MRDFWLLAYPRTWYGLLCVLMENPYGAVQVGSFLKSILVSLVLPLSVFVAANRLLFTDSPACIWPALIATPWATACLSTGALPEIAMGFRRLHTFRSNRFSTLPETMSLWKDRQLSGRLIVHPRLFDLYLPPVHKEPPEHGVVFFPGALVPKEAYADIGVQLSDKGILVAILSTEPTRLVHDHLGAGSRRIRSIQTQIERRFRATSGIDWTLMGHSMGCFQATKVAKLLREKVRRVVLIGMGAFLSLGTDLSSQTDLDILILQGSDDSVVKYANILGQTEAFDKLFPALSTRNVMLEGGTHDGFAGYDEQEFAKATGSLDPRARARQQQACCQAVIDFILRRDSS